MSLAVLTAVYPAAVPYLAEFHRSLIAQTDTEFLLYVLDDGMGDIPARFPGFGRRLVVVPAIGTPSAIRKQGIHRLAADGVESVVFADCDDRCSVNRVAVSRRLLVGCHIVANELIAFGAGMTAEVPMFAPLYRDGQRLGWRDIIHGNVLGLGNTAARVAILVPHLDAIADDLLAFDWALYSRVLHAQHSCWFTTQAETFYRQHAGTVAGYQGREAEELMRCVRVKAAHYAALTDVDPLYGELARGFVQLRDELAGDPEALAAYARAMAAEPSPTGPWWSGARLPAERT